MRNVVVVLCFVFGAFPGGVSSALASTQQDELSAMLMQELATFESLDFVSDGSRGLLRWATTSEEGNAGFEIEYRAPGKSADFISVGFVAGSGTTDAHHDYRFGVVGLQAGVHEFRIKVSAKDGRYRYTRPIRFEVEAESKSAQQFALGEAAHDAEEGIVYIPYTVKRPGIVRLIVEDDAGNLVTTLAFGSHRAGTHVASFRLSRSIPTSGRIWLHTEVGSTSRVLRLKADD